MNTFYPKLNICEPKISYIVRAIINGKKLSTAKALWSYNKKDEGNNKTDNKLKLKADEIKYLFKPLKIALYFSTVSKIIYYSICIMTFFILPIFIFNIMNFSWYVNYVAPLITTILYYTLFIYLFAITIKHLGIIDEMVELYMINFVDKNEIINEYWNDFSKISQTQNTISG